MGMMTLAPTPVCPRCGSLKLTFLEHGAGGTVFQCQLCAQATVQRWEPTSPAAVKVPAEQKFIFPDWFTKTAHR